MFIFNRKVIYKNIFIRQVDKNIVPKTHKEYTEKKKM